MGAGNGWPAPSPPAGALRWGSVHRVFEPCSWILLLTGRGTVLLRAPQTLQSGPSDPASPHPPQGTVAVSSSHSWSGSHPLSGHGEVKGRGSATLWKGLLE